MNDRRPRAATVPWFLWCAALAVTSAYLGGYWDISWHRSIGRDSLWSPPHMAIYACGLLAALSAGYLIFAATFRAEAWRDRGIRIWGLSGPIGAFISAWGGVAMLVSAPFDDWWHNAYGLDVRIISPPHMVLALGFFGIVIGTIVLLVAFMNRAEGARQAAIRRLLLYVGGIAVAESLLVKIENSSRSDMHNALFYAVIMVATPAILMAVAVVSRHRWACTIQVAVYTAINLAFLWILPWFPARPALGPVFREVTHFIPWEFPLLLIVPAVLADVVLDRTQAWRPLVRAAVVGPALFAAFIAVQWPFAVFLMSPAARNWFFGTSYMDFATPDWSSYAKFAFYYREPTTARFTMIMVLAGGIAVLMSWIGLRFGRTMRRIRR